MMPATSGLDDLYAVSSNQLSDHAEEDFVLQDLAMNLTICWWYNPAYNVNWVYTFFSMTAEGMIMQFCFKV